MEKKQIITERLVLRSIQPADRDDIVVILMNDDVKKTYMLPDFSCLEDSYPLFQKLAALSQDANRYVFGIQRDDKMIGFMNDVEIKDDQIEVGYVIHPDYHNCGYATEALTALIHYLHLAGFRSVRAGFFQKNIASMRVMEKAGMKRISFEEDIEYRGETHHCIYFESLDPTK